MSYVGLDPQTPLLNTSTEFFSGNAVNMQFTLARSVASASDLDVIIGNVAQRPFADYTAQNLTLLFAAPPASGTNNITVTYRAGALISLDLTADAFPAGTVGAPGLYSVAANNTGIYWPSAGNMTVTIAGSDRVSFTSTPNSTSTTTGVIQIAGGAGITGNINAGGLVNFSNATESTSVSTGALKVTGGVGIAGNLNIGGDITCVGDFTVNGTFTTTGTDSLEVADPFIFLANANPGDTYDTGVISEYYDGSITRYTGYFRDITDNKFKLFGNLSVKPSTTVDTGNASFQYQDLILSNLLATGNVSGTYLIGNGSLLTGISTDTTRIQNANSIVTIPSINGNVIVNINGVTIGTFSSAGVAFVGSASATGAISATGNILGGNIDTAGLVTATGNVTSAGNVSGGNLVTGGRVISTGNIVGGNIVTAGQVTAGSNITGANIKTAGLMSATGDIYGNNFSATTAINATGNITGGNLITLGAAEIGTGITVSTGGISASGNIVGGNLIATSNIAGGNASLSGTTASTSRTTGALTVAGGAGVAGDLYVGNSVTVDGGAYGNVVTSVFASIWASGSGPNPYSIMQVRSNDGVSGLGMQAYSGSGTLYANTAITFRTGATIRDKDVPSGGTTRATLDSTGLTVTGIVTASGNVTGGNINTAGLITATGNVDGGNINSAGLISSAGTVIATGNITGGNITTAGLITATGNVSGGNINSTGLISSTGTVIATGNITGGNVLTNGLISVGGSVSATGNVTGGNIVTAGLITATGNITSTANVLGGNAIFTTLVQSATISATANVIGANVQTGTLSLSGNVISAINTTSTIITTANIAGGNISTAGNLAAPTAAQNTNTTQVATTAYVIAQASAATPPTIGTNTVGTATTFARADHTHTGVSALTGGGGITISASTGPVTLGSTATSANTAGAIVARGVSGEFSAGVITAVATSARYADLAEMYCSDVDYAPGTVLIFGGDKEVTIAATSSDARIAGVVSTNPAHLMNSTLECECAVAVALTGRVPTFVVGIVRKGDMMVSAGNGQAMACATPTLGSVIGKALEDFTGDQGTIEIVVGRL